jgi:hypothetical protein
VQAYDANTTKNDVANTFTQKNTIKNSRPQLFWNEDDGGVNEKKWLLESN